MSTNLLFVHGGGDAAYVWDSKIVERLQATLTSEVPITFPLFAGLEALDWAQTEKQLGDALRELPPGGSVVAHSVGGEAVLKLLAEGTAPKLTHLFLLAPPYEGADSEWGDTDFSFPADFPKHLPKGLPITLWHDEDDDIIPVESAHRYAEKLPHATVVIVHDYGHQFEGSLTFLAKAIRKAAT